MDYLSLKQLLSKTKSFILSILKHPKEFIAFFKTIRSEEIYLNKIHLTLAADWLLKAQSVGNDNGYSRGFYLQKNGWDKSYIETTGYIIPTMITLYDKFKDEKYKESALKAGEWLLYVQNENGSYSDIDVDTELVFDTGQVLYGLVALYESTITSKKQKKQYFDAIIKASSWLVSAQDVDGSWSSYGYQQIGHSYYSRVSSILFKAGLLCERTEYKDASSKHILWVLDNQLSNGFFEKLEFIKNEKPLLHSIIYVLEGLYDYYLLSGDKKVFKALMKNSEILKVINIKRDLLLCSQYDESFLCVNKQRCMTGLAQWANLSFKLYKMTDDKEYLLCAKKTIYYLKSKQFKENKDLKGALSGSVPFWGYYAPFSATNWGVKFFIDAMLEYEAYEEDLITQSNEWIGECFKFTSHVVSEKFSDTAMLYIKQLTPYIKNAQSVLDLGCGEGKYLRYFQKRFPKKQLLGVDPYFYDNKLVKKGDVYHIEKDKKFDIVYTIEVLQHVKYLNIALKNISKTLKDDGYFIICDRELSGMSRFSKFWYEVRGKWMYPYDSPFTEKWYDKSKWRKILKSNGFTIENIIPIKSSIGKKSGMNKFFILICKKN